MLIIKKIINIYLTFVEAHKNLYTSFLYTIFKKFKLFFIKKEKERNIKIIF